MVVGSASDPAEVEADRIADQVIHELTIARSDTGAPATATESRIRRSAAVVGAAGGAVDADTEQRIRAARGGTPLESGVQRSMEDAFGADFSGVRVHTGSESRELNERIQASAFTTGSDVWFRDGMPDTSSTSGQHLLAHELAHVVQADAAPQRKVQRTTIRRRDNVIRRLDDTVADLKPLQDKAKQLRDQKARLDEQIKAQEGKLDKAGFFAKIGLKSELKKLQKQLAKTAAELDSVNSRVRALRKQKKLDEQRGAEERAEKERLAEEARKAEEQRKIDAATKSYSRLAKMRLGALVDYITATPDWDKNSKIDDAQRAAIAAVKTFAEVAENQAPCATFTLGDMVAAASAAGGTMTDLIHRLDFYVAAAGERRDPFTITTCSTVARAAELGHALERLLGAFPRWVLAGAMEEQQLVSLVDEDFVDDVIGYYQFQAKPPMFQAEEGADFDAYLAMRLDDHIDPRHFQGGPLTPYIRNFHRFAAAALKGLIANFADTSKKRPLTLVLHSAIDHNGAFHRDPNMTDVITHPLNLTLMIEGGATLADYQSLIGPLAKSHGNNDKIDQVMFAGHGGSRDIELAGSLQENTVDVDEHGSIAQVDESIDLDRDPAAAQAFFDEILDNMDKAVVDKLAPPGPAQQQNRRILFNACLTNSNAVRKSLTEDQATARQEIQDYIKNNASLATYMAQYAKGKGADVTSLGANASITQVDLIDPTTGQLDLVAPEDPKVTASKLVYLEEGTEPHGALLAALEAWAYDPVKAKEAMRRRAKKQSTEWDLAIIEGAFELALFLESDKDFAGNLQELADHAEKLSGLKHKDKCRVSTLRSVVKYWAAEPQWNKLLLRRLTKTTLRNDLRHTALVLAQVDAVSRSMPQAATWMVKHVLPNFNAKTVRDFVDVAYLNKGVLATLMAAPATPGSITLALVGVLDPAKPTSCVEHLRKLLSPGEPALPKLPAVPAEPEVPEGVGPRAKIPAVPAVKGRPAVAEIPKMRPASPEVPDLPELPELAAVPGPTSKKAPAPKAPGRPGRPARPEAPAIPELKPYFDPKHDVERLLAGRATPAAIATAVRP